jgi:hypothetical protein
MPDVRDLDVYAKYSAMEVPQLHAALEALKTSPTSYMSGTVEDPPRYADFTDEALPCVVAITKALRKKAAFAGSTGKRSAAPKKPKASSIDDLI